MLHAAARAGGDDREADGAQRGLHLLAAAAREGRGGAGGVRADQQRVLPAEHAAGEGDLPPHPAEPRLPEPGEARGRDAEAADPDAAAAGEDAHVAAEQGVFL